MNEKTNWGEPIFTGTLEMGVDKEKLKTINDENILYFGEASNAVEL